MHHPTDRVTHTTAFVTPIVEHWLEREIAQWVHPMKDRSDDPSHHERTLLPRSYMTVTKAVIEAYNYVTVVICANTMTYILPIQWLLLPYNLCESDSYPYKLPVSR